MISLVYLNTSATEICNPKECHEWLHVMQGFNVSVQHASRSVFQHLSETKISVILFALLFSFSNHALFQLSSSPLSFFKTFFFCSSVFFRVLRYSVGALKPLRAVTNFFAIPMTPRDLRCDVCPRGESRWTPRCITGMTPRCVTDVTAYVTPYATP